MEICAWKKDARLYNQFVCKVYHNMKNNDALSNIFCQISSKINFYIYYR